MSLTWVMKMSDERYDLKLYRMESEEVNDTDTRFHLKYLLTDKLGCTKKEVTLDEVMGLMNTLHNTQDYYFKQTRKQNDRINLLEESLRLKKERIEDLESQLKEVDKVEFGEKLVNLYRKLNDEPQYFIMDYGDNEKVKGDIIPLLQELLDCFNCIYKSDEYQYKNNLIMLKYHVKGFKEVCKTHD